MTIEALAQESIGEAVIEAWSNTIARNPFIQFIDTKFWSFKQGEKWQAVPDKNSQVDFRLQPCRLLRFPNLVLEITTNNCTTITVRGAVTPEGDEAVLISLAGIRLEADRKPDEQSIPPKTIGIDHC